VLAHYLAAAPDRAVGMPTPLDRRCSLRLRSTDREADGGADCQEAEQGDDNRTRIARVVGVGLILGERL
jgi:hypothetical protein